MTKLELKEFQADLGGVLIGTDTHVLIKSIDGLGRPEVRDDDAKRAEADGIMLGADYYEARELRIAAGIRTPGDPAHALDILAALQEQADDSAIRTVGGSLQELRMRWPGRPVKILRGRLRLLDPDMGSLVHGWIPLDIRFIAGDPFWHADTDQQVVARLTRTWEGGFRAPIVTPVRVGLRGNDAGPPSWVSNAGTRPAYPIVTLTGPLVSPRVWIVETGAALRIDGYIPSGVVVEIDTRPLRRTVTRAGAAASTLLASDSPMDLFCFPPGQSEVRWEAAEYHADARLTLTWRASWKAL
ncbi:hypothetical protein [Embleya sp. NPDC059237]|uniref:hypothetical protein n=1 Tax=Embleya sp. NPDC059237 TaxID=3346784 RepID=UPI00367F84AB